MRVASAIKRQGLGPLSTTKHEPLLDQSDFEWTEFYSYGVGIGLSVVLFVFITRPAKQIARKPIRIHMASHLCYSYMAALDQFNYLQ